MSSICFPVKNECGSRSCSHPLRTHAPTSCRHHPTMRLQCQHHQVISPLSNSLVYCKMLHELHCRDWYDIKAVWFNKQLASSIVSALYDLNDVQFDLDSKGYDLDSTWPTFARKQYTSHPAGSSAPSRTISMGSFNSHQVRTL